LKFRIFAHHYNVVY